jgi:hypothetical protein
MLEESFITNIPEDLNQGAMYIIDSFFKENKIGQGPKSTALHDKYLDYLALLEAFLRSHDYEFTSTQLDENRTENMGKIELFFGITEIEMKKRLTHDLISATREKYDILFNNSFGYEFTDGDLQKVQQLLNELRDIISQSELFTAEHQQRILRKLEKLQSELHKKVSDLDRFWGLIGDAGIVIGKFGKDSKPFVDRIREIADIVWRTQSKAEELPSGFKIPLLIERKDDE